MTGITVETSWTVSDFGARIGVPASTLRYWDDIGLLTADRLDNGHRRYRPEHLPRLEMLRMCQALGCTTEEIRLILDAEDPAERADYARRTLPTVIERIAMLHAAVRVLDHVAVCEHRDAATCGAWLRTVLEAETPAGPAPVSVIDRTPRSADTWRAEGTSPRK